MKNKNLKLSTSLLGLFLGGALMVGCSSKKADVAETTLPAPVVAETPSQTTVAQNTNLGAGSSGFSR